MKKLLIITDMFPDCQNPVSGIFVKHQVDKLAEIYDVRVIATYYPHKFMIEQSKEFTYDVTRIYFPYLKCCFFSSVLFYRIYALKEIRRIINKWHPDLIHVHDCRHVPELTALHLLRKTSKIPWYLTAHNIRTHPNVISSKGLMLLYRFWLQQAYLNWTHIFTVNVNLKTIISEFLSPARITVIGNAIHTSPSIDKKFVEPFISQMKDESFKIISVGNLKAEKGFKYLILAVSELTKKHMNIQLLIVGDGSEKHNLEIMIEKLGLSEVIYLAGKLNNEIVRNLYPCFDAFVLPSYQETFGIVYLEAMYAGIPVIGVIGQGIDGIITDGTNGFLTIPKDTADLTHKIEYLITNKEICIEVAQAGQNLIRKRFMLNDLIARIVEKYEQ